MHFKHVRHSFASNDVRGTYSLQQCVTNDVRQMTRSLTVLNAGNDVNEVSARLILGEEGIGGHFHHRPAHTHTQNENFT